MTQQWQTDLESWVTGWEAVREDAPQQDVRVWSGDVPSGDDQVVVCVPDQVESVRSAVQAAGRKVTAAEMLLTGDVQDLDRGLGFPGEAGLFDAPMGDYSRFEVDEWGHPVAHSTLSVQDEVAFMGPLVSDPGTERDSSEVLDPLVSAMANEAFLADAQRLYTVAPEDEMAQREAQGWQVVAVVLRLG